jgi:hypothetical protein
MLFGATVFGVNAQNFQAGPDIFDLTRQKKSGNPDRNRGSILVIAMKRQYLS